MQAARSSNQGPVPRKQGRGRRRSHSLGFRVCRLPHYAYDASPIRARARLNGIIVGAGSLPRRGKSPKENLPRVDGGLFAILRPACIGQLGQGVRPSRKPSWMPNAKFPPKLKRATAGRPDNCVAGFLRCPCLVQRLSDERVLRRKTGQFGARINPLSLVHLWSGRVCRFGIR
jgi:hypothetical protein